MKIIYTKHSKDKLREKEARKFRINKIKIEEVVRNPKNLQQLRLVIRVVGNLDMTHSLCVVYKLTDEGDVKIITFFPVQKGRYES